MARICHAFSGKRNGDASSGYTSDSGGTNARGARTFSLAVVVDGRWSVPMNERAKAFSSYSTCRESRLSTSIQAGWTSTVYGS